jgi:NADH-quinone oxidoreductase subunit K
MDEHVWLQNYLLVGAMLFVLGVVGVLTRRNVIVIFLCVEMMLQGVSLSLVAWSRHHNDWDGQLLVLFIIAVAACEAGIALTLILMLFNRSGVLDIVYWQALREEGQQPYLDTEVPEDTGKGQVWPRLTPAGVRPADDAEREQFRRRV